MRLISGTKLGPCEIVAPIGAGGMGEVYKARSYDVTSDGQRFLVDTVVKAAPPSPVNVILNWTATLKQ